MVSRPSPASTPATSKSRPATNTDHNNNDHNDDHDHDSDIDSGSPTVEELNDAIRRYQAHGDAQALQEIMAAYDWVAVACARRLQRRGEPLDDLQQVAREAVIGAAARFDADRGVQFKSFAWATATGALRHHYRSRWQVRVPRGLQELHLATARATDELTTAEGRDPTVDELAAHMNVSRDDVILALDVGHVYLVDSLDQRRGGEGEGAFDRAVGSVDTAIEATPERLEIRDMLQCLPPNQRTALTMHYFEGSTQSEVGEALGVSQAQVSRLMRSALATLRTRAEAWSLQSPQTVGAR